MVKILTNTDNKVIGIKMKVFSEPVAQGRPRFSNRGKFVRAYDPKKSRDYKQYLRAIAQEVYKERPDFVPFDEALILLVNVYRSIPKSFTKKRQEMALSGSLRPITKPDTDNYIKGVKDACNGVLWRDDSIIVSEFCNKFYSDQPRIEMQVCTLSKHLTFTSC